MSTSSGGPESIEAFFRSFASAYEQADLEAIVDNVSEDILMVSKAGSADTAGKAAFRSLVSGILTSNRVEDFQISIEDSVSLDGHAFVVASYTWTLAQKETPARERQSGRFAMLLKWLPTPRRWVVRREASM